MFRMLLHCFYCYIIAKGNNPIFIHKNIELFPYPLTMLYFVFCPIQMISFKTYILVHIYAHEFKFVDTCVNIFDKFLAEVSIFIM